MIVYCLLVFLSLVAADHDDNSCHDYSCTNNNVAAFDPFRKECYCHCVDESSCSHLNCPHPYCSHFWIFYKCQCGECNTDSHCHCAGGETPRCIKDVFGGHNCHCDSAPVTTTISPKTTQKPTTTQQTLVKLECHHRKISVIESIAENLHVEDSRAALCPRTTKHQTPEAFVINKCNSTAKSSWSQGLSIKAICDNKLPHLEAYTPISTFTPNGEYLAGFFIACNDRGFKMAAQTCTEAPMIINITDFTRPHVSDFYTILS